MADAELMAEIHLFLRRMEINPKHAARFEEKTGRLKAAYERARTVQEVKD